MRRLPLACLTLLSPLLLGCPEKEEDTLTGTVSEGETSGTGTGSTTGDATATTDETGAQTEPDSDAGTAGMSGSESGGVTETGDPPPDTEDPVDDCAFLVDRVFASLEELECGLGPNGVELCNWSISFASDTYQHEYSDVGESGTYTCSNGEISGLDGGGNKRDGKINAATGTLIWQDVTYQPQ